MSVAAQNRQVVRHAYREVWRAINFAFKDDQHMIQSARVFARGQFREDPSTDPKNPLKTPGSAASEQGVEHALAVAQILRQNVVQGTADGNKPEVFKLNIHEETERGDNESIKLKTPLKGTSKSLPRCS
ncbi:hypothetical protein K461DRAFT_292378 [Myriangium duriaei CBS 260.36]|uniref:Mitochondrial zinc maintenance protein 1, mitochondrial n=1 Tax=Myriangium duriaei CBS 260.36 TaxID=1168546 RepID=A0A9P4MHZ4_9PEZI|nr:hypothetical protein K461DRAFT_292378 [Myriangium duriaei CBS 260.36]